MGYSTNFSGQITLDKPLTVAQLNYLTAFSRTRRMKRNSEIAETLPDPIRKAVNLPIGAEGGYFVGSDANFGQDRDASVVEYNSPPAGQPGLWCQWTPTEDGLAIEWDGGEKFYDYVTWMEYIVENFLEPWGIVANGEIEWEGEESGDLGVIVVKANVVTTKEGKVVYEDDEDEEEDDGDTAPTYSRKEVIDALESIVLSAKSALKNIKAGKGDPEGDLSDLHGTINDLYYSVDEGKADVG